MGLRRLVALCHTCDFALKSPNTTFVALCTSLHCTPHLFSSTIHNVPSQISPCPPTLQTRLPCQELRHPSNSFHSPPSREATGCLFSCLPSTIAQHPYNLVHKPESQASCVRQRAIRTNCLGISTQRAKRDGNGCRVPCEARSRKESCL